MRVRFGPGRAVRLPGNGKRGRTRCHGNDLCKMDLSQGYQPNGCESRAQGCVGMPNELRCLRVDLGLPAKDMVAVVQELYPKYDKTMQSKCENGDDYGISIRPDAMKALYAKFAPNGTKVSRRKKDRHRLANRVSCRLEDADMEALQQRMEADGYATAQELLADLVQRYLRGGDADA